MLLLGMYSAGAEVAGAGSFDLLQTYTLASSQASVTFSSLGDYAADYQHLQIRWVAKSDRSSEVDGIAIRFNGDSGTNYSRHSLYGDGTSVGSGAATDQTLGVAGAMAGGNAASGVFGAGVIDILDPFLSSKFTTIKGSAGLSDPGYKAVYLASSVWRNLTAVSSITLDQQLSTNFASGSRFSLYGLKAA